ncbi:10100_t:CDS:2 [Dentiscutata erythropus]|uniref:10100_t:CDS:1 n=1 Tax=Dentiscutata erythropus TaxID=1348616 RepID=A0A9N9FNM0_9GLOM|nr:10100_t:CDS:2 [Dentiscutata erythropus]
MSTSISQNEKKGPEKYIAVSPEGDFLVEFVVKNLVDLEFELQIYNIKNSDNADGSILENDSEQKDGMKPESDPELEDGQKLSYRKFPSIPTTFKFTDRQLNLIKNQHEDIFRWSVAVSDKSTISSSEFRLLAISCINLKDIKYFKENLNKIHPTEIHNHGFTFIFIINITNNDYSISNINDKKLPINYGGIVKLFSKKDYINNQSAEKDKRADKRSQNADGHILIILTLSGIYKYHMKNIFINSIQKLKYPKRIYNAIIDNVNHSFTIFYESERYTYDNICYYIKYCLNKEYFLVRTMKEDIKYMELYDLRTNQLVNTFQMQNLSRTLYIELSPLYAISTNGKLIAYASSVIREIKIYLTESGIEIVRKLVIDTAASTFQFMNFFHNDEMLLVISESKWFVWDIFGSLQDSNKLEDLGFIIEHPLNFDEIEQSNSLMVIDKGGELAIYDDLIIDKYLKYLKKGDEQNWKNLSSDYFLRQDLDNNNIRDLQDEESKLDEYHSILEPWLINTDRRHSRYSFYLDEKKEKFLLIGNHTIQVWHDQGPKEGPKSRTLEFIHVPLSHLPLNYSQDLNKTNWSEFKSIKVIDINYCIGKFKLNIQIEDETSENQVENTFQIKMENRNDIIVAVKYACYSLKYLSVYKKFELFFEDLKLEYENIVEQTRKIILRFIRMYPNEWRLLDIRCDLMSVLIETRDYELLNDILSFKEPLHIPQHLSWTGGISTIRTAFSESFAYYAQKLFYNPCFCDKQLDLTSFKFLEISPKSNDLLKVYIPIIQLIPQDSELQLQDIDYGKIVDIRMVPLTDFTTNKKVSDIRERKFTDFLKLLVSPGQYSSLEDEDYSPFIKFIKKGERDILYENPSMGAVMNWIFILLGYPSYIGLNDSSTTYDPFANLLDSILSVYDWSSISFDIWYFWPLTIVSIVGSFIFVMILQNIIISFMSDAFSDAVTDSKLGVYRFQIDLIHEFALLEKSLEFNDLDSKFKDKIRAKYICFYDDPNITKPWKETSEKMISKQYPNIQTVNKSNFESWSYNDCEFFWGK